MYIQVTTVKDSNVVDFFQRGGFASGIPTNVR